MTSQTRTTLIRIGAAAAFVVVMVWLMVALRSVTSTLLVAFFLAYILNPLVERLTRWGLSRSTAAFLVLLFGLAVVLHIAILVIPAIVQEVAAFSRAAPKYVVALHGLLVGVLERFNINVPTDWDQLTPLIIERLKQWLPRIADVGPRVLASIFVSTLHVLSAIIYVLLVPVIAFYLMVSFDDIKKGMKDLIPPYARSAIVSKAQQIDFVLAGFIRGQLTVALILAILYSVGFLVIGLELAVVIGITGGILWIIPYVGTIFALIAGSTVALAQFGDALHVAYVLIWIGMVQLMEGNLLTPRIVGKAIGLHPVIYILALIAGANLFGFVGLLVAIPVTAVTRVLLLSAVEAYRNSPLYVEGEGKSGGN